VYAHVSVPIASAHVGVWITAIVGRGGEPPIRRKGELELKRQFEAQSDGRPDITLYADYTLLQSNSGPCAAAYAILRLAGHNPHLVYLASGPKAHGRSSMSDGLRPPVLITAAGDVIASLPRIIAWAWREVAATPLAAA
jgi:hypothetical protein